MGDINLYFPYVYIFHLLFPIFSHVSLSLSLSVFCLTPSLILTLYPFVCWWSTFSEENPLPITSRDVIMMKMCVCVCVYHRDDPWGTLHSYVFRNHFYVGPIRKNMMVWVYERHCKLISMRNQAKQEGRTLLGAWKSFFTTEQSGNYHRHILVALQAIALRSVFCIEWLNHGLLQYCQVFSSENRMAPHTFT